MVFCIIALPVFLVLGIFSMRYRLLAREAFDCIFRMATLRPCHSRVDQRIKSGLSGRLMKTHPGLAKFAYKNFKLLSWIFVIILMGSLVFSAWGIVNYAVYGNCNGPVPDSFCVYSEIEKGLGPEKIEGAVQCDPKEYSALENGTSG